MSGEWVERARQRLLDLRERAGGGDTAPAAPRRPRRPRWADWRCWPKGRTTRDEGPPTGRPDGWSDSNRGMARSASRRPNRNPAGPTPHGLWLVGPGGARRGAAAGAGVALGAEGQGRLGRGRRRGRARRLDRRLVVGRGDALLARADGDGGPGAATRGPGRSREGPRGSAAGARPGDPDGGVELRQQRGLGPGAAAPAGADGAGAVGLDRDRVEPGRRAGAGLSGERAADGPVGDVAGLGIVGAEGLGAAGGRGRRLAGRDVPGRDRTARCRAEAGRGAAGGRAEDVRGAGAPECGGGRDERDQERPGRPHDSSKKRRPRHDRRIGPSRTVV